MNSEAGSTKNADSPSPPETRKHALTLKDWIGFAFSALALSISAISYHTNNVPNDNTLLRIADLSLASGREEGYRDGYIVLHVAFINAGNRPALVLGSEYQLSDQPNLDNGGFGGEVEADPGTFPMLISARDLRLAALRIPIKSILLNYSHGAKTTAPRNSRGEELRRFYAGLRTKAVDSLGATHLSWSGMQIAIEVSPTSWHRLGPVDKRENFPLTPLFQ